MQELVRLHGGSDAELHNPSLGASNIKWLAIGALVPNRTGKQCRERWHNLLNPLDETATTAGLIAAVFKRPDAHRMVGSLCLCLL